MIAVIGPVSIAISRTGTGAASTRDPGIGFAGRRLRQSLAGVEAIMSAGRSLDSATIANPITARGYEHLGHYFQLM